jgi:hypothetical protein
MLNDTRMTPDKMKEIASDVAKRLIGYDGGLGT